MGRAMRIIAVLAAVAAWSIAARAQVVVEPEVVTDSVDVFAGSEKPAKSRTVASAISLLVPGLGHQYVGNDSRALAYYCTDALLLASLIFSERYSQRMFSDSRAYAWLYADAHGAGTDESYWKNVGSFMDADEYNRVMELNRTPEDKYSDPQQLWRWNDEYFKTEYNGMRETATRFHVVSSFCIAAMVLDRVIAFIDIRKSTKYKGIESHASVRILPYYSLSTNKMGIAVTGKL
jgi:hypothetical protein